MLNSIANKVHSTNVLIYIFLFFVLNSFMGALVGLSYDESYYWMYSNFLSFGYFDHPPMVAWLIKLGTVLFDNEFGVRLPFNILSSLTLFITWNLTDKKNPFAFITLSLSLILIQSSGFLALPDTPLMFFSVLFLWLTIRYLDQDTIVNSILLAVTIACLFYSKYHGLLVVLLTVAAIPQILKRKSFWIIVILVILLYAPHMYWQYKHDFISFKFHLTGRAEKHFEFKNILNYILSQIVLFGMGFFFFLLFAMKRINMFSKIERIITFNIFGFLILLFFMSFRNQIEANWTVTACAFFLVLGTNLITRVQASKRTLLLICFLPITLILSLRVVLLLPDSFYAGKKIGRLNEVKGWEPRISKIQEVAKGELIVAETYQYGAKVSFEMRNIIPVKHFKGRDSHYSILNLTDGINKDQLIYYLTPRKHSNSVKIDTGYKDPIYIIETTLRTLEEKYKK